MHTIIQGCCEASTTDDSHVPSPWLEEVQQCLPLVISGPCKLSLGLNVDTTSQTLAKLDFLLESIKGADQGCQNLITRDCFSARS